MLLPGQRPAQEARWPAVGNTAMSAPISAIMHSAARLPTPVMVSRWSRATAKRGDGPVDGLVQGGDGPLQLLDVLQRQPQQQGVVGVKAATQRLAQRGELGAQPAP